MTPFLRKTKAHYDMKKRSTDMKGARRQTLMLLAASIFSAGMAASPLQASDGNMAGVEGLGSDAWAALAGSTLKSTLEGWARISEPEWSVIWDNPTDYRIRASATFYGSFEDTVGRLVDAIHQSNPELSVTLYRGNRVIHVDALTITSE